MLGRVETVENCFPGTEEYRRLEVLLLSSSRYASGSKHCNSNCSQCYCCAEEEELQEVGTVTQSAMNHLANDARKLYEKGCAVVATRSLRITDFPVSPRRCVTRLSLFQLASVDLWSACRYSSSASNSCKARHVEALKNIRCNSSNFSCKSSLTYLTFCRYRRSGLLYPT